ncbi:unnamed protein product [Dracunculus medinensis]|uniref:DUF1758 domain-containing protein n=1 Tax=Dracunculus medinensis TaxID=318479 RepID=A0A0N4UIA8_DRAME|nr:unnamed protein product [Dracunculus medinensis]
MKYSNKKLTRRDLQTILYDYVFTALFYQRFLVSHTKATNDFLRNLCVIYNKTIQINQIKWSSYHESTTQPKKIARDKRPCAFCNKDHWDNECSTYPTLQQRMEYLRKNNACLNCFRTGHATNNCNKKKRSCFHCKNPHNTALCYMKYGMQTAESKNLANVINSIAQSIHQQGQEILLLCKEIEIVNPIMPENHEKILVLFDIGSQSSFISTKLANRLRLPDGQTKDLPHIISLEQLDHGGDWKRPDILIGADYFFDFMSPYEFYKTSSGFYLLELDTLTTIVVVRLQTE